MSRLRRFYPKRFATNELLDLLASIQKDKESDVNIVDKETDGEVGGQDLLESQDLNFPARPVNSNPEGADSANTRILRTSEIGQELTQLTTEREKSKTRQDISQHGLWNDSYSDDDRFEDADLKLGSEESENDDTDPLTYPVYEPYHQGTGPLESRYEDADKNKHNIILHSSRKNEKAAAEQSDGNTGEDDKYGLWICIDLDGTILEAPEEYQDEKGNHLFGEVLPGNQGGPGPREALQELIDGGARVSIYTARQYFEEDYDKLIFDVEEVLIDNGIPFSDVYIGEKPPAHHFVDDRSIPGFDGDWDLVLDTVRDKLTKNAQTEDIYTATLIIGDVKHIDTVEEENFYIEVGEYLEEIGFTVQYDAGLPYTEPSPACDSSIWIAHSRGADRLRFAPSNVITLELESNNGHFEFTPEMKEDIDMAVAKLESKYNKNANDPVKDSVDFHGIRIDIEWPAGSIRSYEGDDTYVTHMKADYGYARGIEGNDGEELDIYIIDRNSDSESAFIIEQVREDGSYDEDKIVLGAYSEGEAVDCYLQHMPSYMLGDVREVPLDKLRDALYNGPEDRSGEDDVIPSEEQNKEAQAWKDPQEWTISTEELFEHMDELRTNNPDEFKFWLDFIGAENEQHYEDMKDTWNAPNVNIVLRGLPKTSNIKWIRKVAAYSDLAIKAIEDANINETTQLVSQYIDISGDYINMVDSLTRAMINNPELVEILEAQYGPAEEKKRPFEEEVKKEIGEHPSAFWGPIQQPASPTETQEVQGPSGTQPIVRACIAAKEAEGTQGVWPEDDIFENEYTDGLETRENRSIRRPPKTEHMKYRNAQKEIIRKTRTKEEEYEVCPHCNEEIQEKSIFWDQENDLWYHADCKEPITIPHKSLDTQLSEMFG